jgi:hypothetical protein
LLKGRSPDFLGGWIEVCQRKKSELLYEAVINVCGITLDSGIIFATLQSYILITTLNVLVTIFQSFFPVSKWKNILAVRAQELFWYLYSVKDMDLVSVFCRWIFIFPTASVEEAVFTPSYTLGSFVKNQVGVAAWIHIWVSGSSILFHWTSCLFL